MQGYLIALGMSASILMFSMAASLPGGAPDITAPAGQVAPKNATVAEVTPSVGAGEPAKPAAVAPSADLPVIELVKESIAAACDPACKCGATGVCTCGDSCPCKCVKAPSGGEVVGATDAVGEGVFDPIKPNWPPRFETNTNKAAEAGKPAENFSFSTSPQRAVACNSLRPMAGQSASPPVSQQSYRVVSGPFRLLWWIEPNTSSTTVATHAEPFSMKTQSVLVPSQKTQVTRQPAQRWTDLPSGYTTPPGSRSTICSGGSCSRGW